MHAAFLSKLNISDACKFGCEQLEKLELALKVVRGKLLGRANGGAP